VAGGCAREKPPEIPDPALPRPAKVVKEEPKVEVVEASETPVEAPPPPPAPKAEAPKPAPVVAAKPEEAPKPVEAAPAAKAPTIVGTWRAVEMSQRGQVMPAQMNIQFTFGEDGTVSMSMSMEGMPEPHSESGTYTLNGEQITISIRNDSKSGTLKFEGDSRATMEVAEVKVVLERV